MQVVPGGEIKQGLGQGEVPAFGLGVPVKGALGDDRLPGGVKAHDLGADRLRVLAAYAIARVDLGQQGRQGDIFVFEVGQVLGFLGAQLGVVLQGQLVDIQQRVADRRQAERQAAERCDPYQGAAEEGGRHGNSFSRRVVARVV